MIDANPHPGVLVTRLAVLYLLYQITLELLIRVLPYHHSTAVPQGIPFHHSLYSFVLLEEVDVGGRFLMFFEFVEATDGGFEGFAFAVVLLLEFLPETDQAVLDVGGVPPQVALFFRNCLLL